MQQSSSLIFLAIVIIWAAYLLQHWVRRREALATARSVDEFSDAMRVLERREHPTGVGVLEQVADPSSGQPAEPARTRVPRPSLRAGTVMTGEPQPPVTDHEPESRPEGRGGLERVGRTLVTAGSPKLRAIALILSVALLLITVVCAPFGALPWWSPVLMLIASGGAFFWCRASALAAAAARGSRGVPVTRNAPMKAGRPRRAAVRLPRRSATVVPAQAPAQDVVPLAKATMPAPVVEAPAPPQPRQEQVFDISAGDAPAVAAPAAPQMPAAQSADGWRPVAVPPPTYTMKERAPERPQPAPAATTDPKSYEHVANEDLPFDGLALDQDLDDLPSVFRAG
ncbi:hypothetical protein [Flexivirga caeni]|uniref:Uncharacterized protein n=1 Tax=Flexivirga caeni TaxID=2294115 RepID=A0A3M9ME97_9MICO|nr:hypothetical protein [Flexivirga caeni]RNI23891.1 hypothetical protein EFY87_06375 [Flexivirga caeni]